MFFDIGSDVVNTLRLARIHCCSDMYCALNYALCKGLRGMVIDTNAPQMQSYMLYGLILPAEVGFMQ